MSAVRRYRGAMDATVAAEGNELRVSGEIDAHSVSVVDAALAEADPTSEIALDLSDVSFIDSSGLRALVAAHKRTEAAGGGLVLVGPSQPVLRLLGLTGLDQVLAIR